MQEVSLSISPTKGGESKTSPKAHKSLRRRLPIDYKRITFPTQIMLQQRPLDQNPVDPLPSLQLQSISPEVLGYP